jgi:hypothetical protein
MGEDLFSKVPVMIVYSAGYADSNVAVAQIRGINYWLTQGYFVSSNGEFKKV